MRKEINQEVLLEVIRKRSHPQPQVYTKEEQNIIDTALKKQVVKTCHTMHGACFGQIYPVRNAEKFCR